MPFKPDDHVLHHPSGETWVVKSDDGEYLEWKGWPPGRGKSSDCSLVEPAAPTPAPSSPTSDEPPDLPHAR